MIDIEIATGGLAISAISWAELKYGAEKSQNKERNWEQCEILLTSFDIEILSVDKVIVEKYGMLKNWHEKKGSKVEDFDLLIAATALVYELKLVTENVKHFEKIDGLKLA
jgi:tRNA(fMet)-specific endonuclease VapC